MQQVHGRSVTKRHISFKTTELHYLQEPQEQNVVLFSMFCLLSESESTKGNALAGYYPLHLSCYLSDCNPISSARIQKANKQKYRILFGRHIPVFCPYRRKMLKA